jgi:acetyltransferase-like isoleucine patch superfamily enzyme
METEELASLVGALRRSRDSELRERWQRSLPFGDAMFDRWDRAHDLGFGAGVSIYDSACVYGDVTVAEATWIGPFVVLDGSGGGLQIGAYCSISAGVHIYTHDTVLWALSGGAADRRTAPVVIGDCTYVGSQSVVAAGSHIGDHCVVSANSFVKGDVPARSVVAGTPAKVIGRVEGSGLAVAIRYDRDNGT